MARTLTMEDVDNLDGMSPEQIEAFERTLTDDATTTTTDEPLTETEKADANGARDHLTNEEYNADQRAIEGKPADEDDPEALAALLEEEGATPAPAPGLPQYAVGEVDFAAKSAELAAKKAAAMKQLMDGDIDADAYGAVDAEVTAAQADLIRDRTLAEANRQHAEAVQAAQVAELQGHIKSLMAASQGTVLDYSSDVKAQAQFDSALRMIANDPDKAGLSPKEAVAEAHKFVRAYRGIVEPTGKTPPPAPAPAGPRNVPPTLGNVPAAAPNNVAADLRQRFAMLSGDEAEDFLEQLPKAQRQALLAGGALV